MGSSSSFHVGRAQARQAAALPASPSHSPRTGATSAWTAALSGCPPRTGQRPDPCTSCMRTCWASPALAGLLPWRPCRASTARASPPAAATCAVASPPASSRCTRWMVQLCPPWRRCTARPPLACTRWAPRQVPLPTKQIATACIPVSSALNGVTSEAGCWEGSCRCHSGTASMRELP